MQYVMFLRGINVGGIKVPMNELRSCLEDLGLKTVKTFLQTGNVIFSSDKAITDLKPSIEKKLSSQFNYEAFALLYPLDVLNDVVLNCPFAPTDGWHRYAIFCENKTVIDELVSHASTLDESIERIAPGSNVVYWTVPQGSTLKTEFSKIMAKPKYKSVTTNRNINTLEKMLAQ